MLEKIANTEDAEQKEILEKSIEIGLDSLK